MSAIKRLIEDVVEMYDENGMDVVTIAKATGLSEEEVFTIISEYSVDFNTL